jgi:type IV secretion system protein VirB5
LNTKLIAFVLASLAVSPAYAQIPVSITSSVPDTVNQIETMTKWATQYGQMVAQIDQMKKQYDSLTGPRGLGTAMNNPSLRDYLPNNWQGIYDAVRAGGYAGLSGPAKSLYDQNKVFDSCAHLTVVDQRIACQASAVKPSQDKSFALDAYGAAKGRLTQIDQLMRAINNTQDPKAIAELQGRIAAEQAMIQNEQTKLQLYAMVSQAEDKVQEQRQREMNARTWSGRKGIQAAPITFTAR